MCAMCVYLFNQVIQEALPDFEKRKKKKLYCTARVPQSGGQAGYACMYIIIPVGTVGNIFFDAVTLLGGCQEDVKYRCVFCDMVIKIKRLRLLLCPLLKV